MLENLEPVLSETLLLVGLVGALVSFLVGMRLRRRHSRRRSFGFVHSAAVLSRAEASFMRRVQFAIGDAYVLFPHVSLTSLVRPRTRNYKLRRQALSLVSQSRVDFAVCRADSFNLVCVVELDDSSNDEAADRSRDALLANAGIVTLRFSTSKMPSDLEIAAHLSAVEDRARRVSPDSVASFISGADSDWSFTGARPAAK